MWAIVLLVWSGQKGGAASTVWVGRLDNEEKVFGRRRAADCFYSLKTVGAERVEAHAVFFVYKVF